MLRGSQTCLERHAAPSRTHVSRHLQASCAQQRRPRRKLLPVKSSKQLQQHVLLEQAALADMPTEQLLHLLQQHGLKLPEEESLQQQQQQEQQQATTTVPDQQQQQYTRLKQHQQQQQQLAQQKTSRAARVAATARRRSALLKQLAAARVAARARIVRLPLRLTVAGKAGSRRYLTVPVDVEGVGFVDFLLDGSSLLSRITPALRSQLGMGPADGVAVVTGRKQNTTAAAAQGSSNSSSSGSGGAGYADVALSSGASRLRLRQRVQLPDMWLGTAKLPPQQAYVAPLLLPPRRQQQQQQQQQHSSTSLPAAAAVTVGGLLGVQVLRCFDVDIDTAGNQLALHPAGHVELGLCDVRGMTPLPCRVTKSGAIVLPVSLAGSAPFTALLDLSATTSILNWEAAALLGMTCTEHQQQQQQSRGSTGGSSSSNSSKLVKNMYGYFGNIEVVRDDEMLSRPKLPGGRSSSSGGADMLHHTEQQQQQLPGGSSSSSGSYVDTELSLPHDLSNSSSSSSSNFVKLGGTAHTSSSSGSNSSSSSNGSSITPLRVQKHQVAASAVKLVLGHARLAAAAAVGGRRSSSSSSRGSLALSPPARFGVAGLRGLQQLGLAGQPAMVVGADIWARQRAVLCLKSGWLYLEDRPPQVYSSTSAAATDAGSSGSSA